jgi:hypothetical protein
LQSQAEPDNAFGQEVQAVVDGWRAVLGPDLPYDGPFNLDGLDTRLAEMAAPAGTGPPPSIQMLAYDAGSDRSAVFVDGTVAAGNHSPASSHYQPLQVLIEATRLPYSPASSTDRPPLPARQQFAANATYRTYVNQGIANALALPYLPGTLRMPFRRLFVKRAAEVQDELVSVAFADQAFAQRQPSSPLILPFFTASVLQGATTREDIWAQMARAWEQSADFRRIRANLDRELERSQVSAGALRFQSAIRDEALKLADVAGAAQQTASVTLGVMAQTGIVPMAGALNVLVNAAQGAGGGGSWTRIWRQLFHRHEHFLAQTNGQAIALTNALPQIQQLWEMPKIGGYLKHFAITTQQMGRVLRD